MSTRFITLIFVAAVGFHAQAQTAWLNAPDEVDPESLRSMNLGEVSIEDLGVPGDLTVPSRGASPAVEQGPDHLRQTESQRQLSDLHKPIGTIALSDLVAHTGQPPNVAERLRVSQPGFTPESRVISSGEVTGGDIASTSTIYTRRRLCFENVGLERCGTPAGCVRAFTNARSLAKFWIDTALLPLRMVHHHPDKLVSQFAK